MSFKLDFHSTLMHTTLNKNNPPTYLYINIFICRHYGNTHGKSNILTSGDLTSFMYQVARGMDYLSSRGVRTNKLNIYK